MAFHEIQFPTDISYGSSGGPGYRTDIIEQESGAKEFVSRRTNALRRYNVAYGIKSRESLTAVYTFYLARMGPAYGFRLKDWLDFTTNDNLNTATKDDQNLGTGDGSTTTFQLLKRYVSGPATKIRNLTKPVAGTILCALNGVSTGAFTTDTATGVVTFTAAPGVGVVVTAGCEFDVPVHFGKEVDEDAIRASIDDFGHGHIEDLPLYELPDGVAVYDDVVCGGAVEICITANYQLVPGWAKTYVVEPNAASLALFLPDPTTCPTGGPLFWLANVGPNSVAVKTFGGGSTVVTLAVGTSVEIALTIDGASAKQWYVL